MVRTTIAILFLIGCSGANKEAREETQAEVSATLEETRRDAVTDELFGAKVDDPYRWLEDAETAPVRSWMTKENDHARAYLKALPEREGLAARLKELTYLDTQSAPLERKGRMFYWKKGAEQEKAVLFVKRPTEEPVVVLDPNTMSPDGSLSIGEAVPSDDGKLLAYSVKANNTDQFDLHIIDVDTQRELDLLPSLFYTTPSWTPDNRGFFYTWMPNDPNIADTDRIGFSEIRFHTIGSPDDEVYREKTGDPTKYMFAKVSDDGKYLFLTIATGWSETDLYVLNRMEKGKIWRELAVGTKANYGVDAFKDTFYVVSDHEAPRKRVFAVNPKKLARKDWKLIIPEEPNAVIDEMVIAGNKLALTYLENASSRLDVFELSGRKVRSVALPGIGTVDGLVGRHESDTAYFNFGSFATPAEVHETSISKGTTKVYAAPKAPLDPAQFEVKQVWYPSKDGTKISMFIVAKKGLALDGDNPTLLYGYGGFNISQTPEFKEVRIPWLERGGVVALPNLRGGGEYGEAWHQAGMKANKQNVFDDFIAAAEWLIKEKYTQPSRLAIQGRSNGGLLVGAAMTQRPDLVRAVICGVPLLDMVRYHLVGIGKAWIPEYGSPEVKEEFEFLHGYSPYHRVREGTSYPALLMLSADHDDRVDPMHARKFHAAIAHASTSGRPNLLRIETQSGHGGADLRKASVEQWIDELSFLLAEISQPAPQAQK